MRMGFYSNLTQQRGNFGFTLLEVLVSLSILALVMSVLVSGGARFLSDVNDLRDRYIASLVANNRIAEIRLMETWPPIGSVVGVEQIIGMRWKWESVVQATLDQDVRKVEVSIKRDAHHEGKPLTSLVAYVRIK